MSYKNFREDNNCDGDNNRRYGKHRKSFDDYLEEQDREKRTKERRDNRKQSYRNSF